MNIERDLAAELDELRSAVASLSAQMTAFFAQKAPAAPNPKVGHVEKMPGMIPHEHLATEPDLLENTCVAAAVLKCIGSQEKLSILPAILRQPRTVAQLVGECCFTSAGQVYHHLKPLIAANIVAEDEKRRQYIIVPHRVQGLVMLLAGICNLTDVSFSQGDFSDA